MMDQLFTQFVNALFSPNFAAGAVSGGILTYYATSREWITTGRMTTLREELAKLNAKLEHTESELTALRQEVQAFVEWRKNIVTEKLTSIND